MITMRLFVSIFLVVALIYPTLGIPCTPRVGTVHQRTFETGTYPNLSLTLLPPFLQVKPSGTLPISYLLLSPETTIDCKEVEKWLKESSLIDSNLPNGLSNSTNKVPSKEINVSKGSSKPVSTKYRIDSNSTLSLNPLIPQLVKKMNDWFISNGYPLSRVDESASYFGFVPETNSMMLYIHTYEPKLSEVEPVKITFLQKGSEGETWKSKPNHTHAITPRLSAKAPDNINYTITSSKTDEDWLSNYLGLKPGEPFNWNPEKWAHLFSSGILSEGEAILYKNPDESISIHLNIVEGQLRKIEPGIHKSLSLDSDFGLKLKFQELHFDGKGKAIVLEWDQSPIFLFNGRPQLSLKFRYSSNILAYVNSKLPLFEMNLFSELATKPQENSTNKSPIILRGETIFSDTLIIPTENYSRHYIGTTKKGANLLLRGAYTIIKPIQFSYNMSIANEKPWSNDNSKDKSNDSHEDQLKWELQLKPLNAPKWLKDLTFRSNMGILFNYTNLSQDRFKENNKFSILKPHTWLRSNYNNMFETQNYQLKNLFNKHTISYKIDMPIQAIPNSMSKEKDQPIFDVDNVHITTQGEASIVMFPLWYLNQLTHMILDQNYTFSNDTYLWQSPPSDEVFKGGTENLRGYHNKAFGPLQSSFSQSHQISIPITFQRWGINLPFSMSVIGFTDYMMGMMSKKQINNNSTTNNYPKSIKTAKKIFSRYWDVYELKWASSIGWGCRIGRLAVDVAHPVSPKVEKAKVHIYMTP